MKLSVGEHGVLEISEAYVGFMLVTELDRYGICERDGRIEINGTLTSADIEAAVEKAEEERERIADALCKIADDSYWGEGRRVGNWIRRGAEMGDFPFNESEDNDWFTALRGEGDNSPEKAPGFAPDRRGPKSGTQTPPKR